jgi:hypothetical protein
MSPSSVSYESDAFAERRAQKGTGGGVSGGLEPSRRHGRLGSTVASPWKDNAARVGR